MRKKTNAISIIMLIAAMLVSNANAQSVRLADQSACNRACLAGFMDVYFDGLGANDANIVPLSPNAKVSNNGRWVDLSEAFWENAERIVYRWDIANMRLGDTAAEAIIEDSDGSKTMLMVRLKVLDNMISEVEIVTTREGDADGLWDADRLTSVSPALQLSIREAERDSYYRLIAAAESYWRAFQTNGTAEYHPADLLPDTLRFENGLQTTGVIRNGVYASTASGFDAGRFIGRNLWDRRYSVVDEERGIVLSMVRFGLKDGLESQSAATSNDRLVAEFFAIKGGKIQEIHAVLFNLKDSVSSIWEADYGPDQGGW